MKNEKYLKIVTLLALAGTLFAGYLSGVKLFSGTCAFNESCPYFLGYPTCWYGFAMFATMLAVSAAAHFKKLDAVKATKTNLIVSGLGILFAGYFGLRELIPLLSGAGPRYALGLPTCVYGLVFYVIIFVISLRQLRPAGAVDAPAKTP